MTMRALKEVRFSDAPPLWGVVGVLILSGVLLLPSLHHLPGHDGGADSDETCALCLLLELSFLAVPVLLGALLTYLVVALLDADLGAIPMVVSRGTSGARGPPLSS